jgi:enhancing lycopene biosynthesis protein 2
MAKIGVVLSGCGVYDGSEIHEATLTLFFLDKAGAEIVCMAPDASQSDVVNHLNCEPVGEKRGIMTESARIARGEIKDIASVGAADIDALVFPGGMGAAKNLCDFAVKGENCTVDPEVARLVKEMHSAGKTTAFMCIAPVIAAKVLGEFEPQLTAGNNAGIAAALEKMGAKNIESEVDGIVIDKKNKIVSTPAYIIGPTISHVALGIEKLVLEVMNMLG